MLEWLVNKLEEDYEIYYQFYLGLCTSRFFNA